MPHKGFKYKTNDNRYSSRSGGHHWAWRKKSETIKYTSLHQWIYKVAGRASHCEQCGSTEIPNGKKRWFEWSCLDGKYSRNVKNWMQLCIPCHRKVDRWREKISMGSAEYHYKETIKL